MTLLASQRIQTLLSLVDSAQLPQTLGQSAFVPSGAAWTGGVVDDAGAGAELAVIVHTSFAFLPSIPVP